MFSLNQGKTANFDLLCLQISPAYQQEAWQESEKQSNAIARHNAYLNYVSLKAFLTWLSEESEVQPSVWPSQNSLPAIWEVVNGTAIQLGETRLVLIPCDDADKSELCVPQEWVDIPNWVADYYIAVEVILDGDEDDCFLRVGGFTTHRQLKNKGRYNESDRTYSLPTESLTKNLTVMQATIGLCLQEKVPPLPTLSIAQIMNLLKILSDSSLYSPRLRVDIPFEEWAALLADEKSRQQLYNRRMGLLIPDFTPSQQPIVLKGWLQDIVEKGRNAVDDIWQTFETLYAQPEAVRSRVKSQTSSPDAIGPVISLLQPHQSDRIRRQAAGVIGEIGAGNRDAIEALIQLLKTTQDEETRWQASLSLGKIDPGNPLAGVKKARRIDMGMQLGGHRLGLIVAIRPKLEERIGVSLQVQPLDNSTKLPPNLKLSVLSESGETISGLETQARSDDEGRGKDEFLELRFSPPPRKLFRVRLSVDNLNITEDFIA
ncbi:DUF1822 family protein [Argonema galeatum]|uniref:DUF1822 family protein n=1 Tax=Argonema galeatum TaxID=2942762 RepID=UPI002010EA7E|nr:DUF1822 family protein [Argonema galeatum]MCL1463896.1 DUF1822 family protein [Argonema galeatum A003/A1]